jgi:hypothetical protein
MTSDRIAMTICSLLLTCGICVTGQTTEPAAPAISPAEVQRIVEQVLRALQAAAPAADASIDNQPPQAPPPPAATPSPMASPPGRPPVGGEPPTGTPPRDPFATSPTMERESQRLGLNAQQGGIAVPQLTLKGCCHDREVAVAWLETSDGRLILARQGEPVWIGSLELMVKGVVDGALEVEIPSLDITLSLR